MRRIILLISLSLLLGVWAIANSGPYPYHPRDQVSRVTVEGCLYGSNGNFNLVDDRGNTVQLKGKTAKLDDFIGQRVRLEGKTADIGKPGAMSANEGEAITTLHVSRIEHVSGHFCENGTGVK
jgi:Protein of unknown function (DUF5818)